MCVYVCVYVCVFYLPSCFWSRCDQYGRFMASLSHTGSVMVYKASPSTKCAVLGHTGKHHLLHTVRQGRMGTAYSHTLAAKKRKKTNI